MSVSSSVTLPAQPTQGVTEFIPLGGDGKYSPLGCYFCRLEIDGDAGGGNASLTINFDRRYTNLVAYVNLAIQADAAAGDFLTRLQPIASATPAQQLICGTIPHVATAIATDNAAFLWYPPPVYYQGRGLSFTGFPNVGVNETYKVTVEIYVFDIDIRRLTPLNFLQMNVPGVSAPAAI